MSSQAPWLGRARHVVERLTLAWALLLLLVFVWRVGFPLELEWMEGGVLHQARRIQLGQSPYPPPSPDFVPFLYTPGYAVVLAGLGLVFPLGFTLGRLVSGLAFIAVGWALWRAVRGEGKPRAHAAAAVGLACSGYVFTFRWLDLARPDTLYMALVLWGLVLLRHSRARASRAVWAGVLVALAFWTKQTAASFVIASGVGALLVAPRRLWIYAGTIALIDGGGVLLGNAMTDGWLWTYIYELHQSHAFNRERFTTKTWGMFLHAWPWVGLVGLGLASRGLGRLPLRLRRWWSERAAKSDATTGAPSPPAGSASPPPSAPPSGGGLAYWGLMAAAGLLVSAVGYATQWAEPNAFIPGVVLGALALAVAVPVGGVAELASLILVAAQLLFGLLVEPLYQPIQTKGLAGLSRSYAWQDPWRTLPTRIRWRRAAELRAALQDAPGPVLAIHRPWWSVLAGGHGHVGSMGLTDVEPEARKRMEAELRAAVHEQRYAWVWIEGEPPRWLARALLRRYRVQQRRHGEARVRPLSGYMSEAGMVTPYRRDQLLLVPKGPRPRPPGATVIADFEDNSLEGFTTEGGAFGRPQRGTPRGLPVAGPYGGQALLTSASLRGSLSLTGSALSPAITLPSTGRLEMLVGHAGRREGLRAELVEQGGAGRRVALPIPATRNALAPVRFTIEPDWAGVQIRLRLEDQSPEACLYFDDLWVVVED